MFSERTDWDLSPNRLFKKKEELTAGGVAILDLTESNPTRCGFLYPSGWLRPFQDPRLLQYEPDPAGFLEVRKAVASIYRAKGVPVGHEQIVLTASTSEAYHFLLRILCDPGDEILVPVPSYPLFDYLAQLSDVRTVPYPLVYENGWSIPADRLRGQVSPITRAAVVVHPNNPTGSCLTAGEKEEVLAVCGRAGIPLISDEVFAEYIMEPRREIPPTLVGDPRVLVFSLGGISKFLGLPQMKMGWIAVTGPDQQVRKAVGRLELIADTYLSVNTPVQIAFPEWCASAASMQEQIRLRLRSNRRRLEEWLIGSGIRLLASDGGWSAVLEIGGVRDEEEFALRLLTEHRVLVYPGYFFDFEKPGICVVSLLVEEGKLRDGIGRLLACLEKDSHVRLQ
ncbi:MAG: pyridoxal phosphate-dependent aminotransferase [Candidatus Omnitrophica bacterium]|nr:pyridoxal phosphate-dependent aminotransferase [Candidatus Omnitrophota bacterium]